MLEGCSSLQFEVSCKENEYTEDEMISGTVGRMLKSGVLDEKDILFAFSGMNHLPMLSSRNQYIR